MIGIVVALDYLLRPERRMQGRGLSRPVRDYQLRATASIYYTHPFVCD